MKVLKLLLAFLLGCGVARAQQPQTNNPPAPIYAANAKYVQGVGPGYWPTPGAGLVLNLSGGRTRCGATMTNYAGGTLTMANNTTNYVYLDTAAACAPASNTSGYTSALINIATVVTSGGAITTITDDRVFGIENKVGGALGTVSSVALTMPSWFAVAGSPITTSGTFAVTAATGQTSHQVIGTCGAATSFAPCTLVEGDLPAATVFTDQSATFGAHTYDFSGVTLMKLRVGASCTTSANGDICYDSSANRWHFWANGADVSIDIPSVKIRSFGTTFGDTTGSALTSGPVVYFTIPYACTITAWNITVDAGTVTFDIWKIATGTAIPTVSNTITASAKPALSTGTALHSTSMSGWTTSVAANDIFGIQLNTVATAKYAELDIQCNQN